MHLILNAAWSRELCTLLQVMSGAERNCTFFYGWEKSVHPLLHFSSQHFFNSTLMPENIRNFYPLSFLLLQTCPLAKTSKTGDPNVLTQGKSWKGEQRQNRIQIHMLSPTTRFTSKLCMCTLQNVEILTRWWENINILNPWKQWWVKNWSLISLGGKNVYIGGQH